MSFKAAPVYDLAVLAASSTLPRISEEKLRIAREALARGQIVEITANGKVLSRMYPDGRSESFYP